jgi:3-oxoacyl-[acyl-carrier protein] reductase
VVTGSSSGIGEAVAHRLAADGYAVVVNSRTIARAQKVAADIENAGGTAVPVAADVASATDIDHLFDAADALDGPMEVLVNNAGAALVEPSVSVSRDQWRALMSLNLEGPFFCAQAAAQRMQTHGQGTIVNISSIAGVTALPGRSVYTITKHGMTGMTAALGAEWAPSGIRVVGIAPAFVDTPLVQQARRSGGFAERLLLERTPMGRLGEAREVADAVAFACSSGASYITGSTILVDGGWIADGGARSR